MDIKDLHIGFWYHFKGDGLYWNPATKKQEKDFEFQWEMGHFADYINGNLNIDHVHRIKLTEEWLLKFEFERQGDVFIGYEQDLIYPYYYIKDVGIALVGDIYRLWINSEDEWYSFPWTDINYVHELQLLYCSLTKTELTIKA